MGLITKHNGSSFADINPQKFNGSSWVDMDVFKSNGSAWENMTSQQYATTWEATWSQTYRESGTKRTDHRADKLCQGKYSGDSNPWGITRALCGFDDADMRSKLTGAKIDKVELYLKNEHWYYYAGGTVVVGYHNHASEPTNFSHSKYNAKTDSYSARGQAKWITMPKEFGEQLRDGSAKGFSIFANSTSYNYYGIFYGAYDGSSRPKIKITYTK